MITKANIKRNKTNVGLVPYRKRRKINKQIKYRIRRLTLYLCIVVSLVLLIKCVSSTNKSNEQMKSQLNEQVEYINSEVSQIDEKINTSVSEQMITREEMKSIVREVLQEEQANQLTEEKVNEIVDKKITSRGGTRRDLETNLTSLGQFKMTSYHDGDAYLTTNITGSGKTTADFQVNEKGWYTYNGKIVLAAATNELKQSGYSKKGSQEEQDKYYFTYNQNVKVVIDGITYDGIILDSCGAAMWKGEKRIDLFVSSSKYVTNRTVEVFI